MNKLASCVKAFIKAENRKTAKNYDKFYVLVDIHETMLKPNYEKSEPSCEWYPHAKDVMQYLTQRNDVVLILWTCSHANHVQEYLRFFESNGVKFQYYNENPECADIKNEFGGAYDKKMFANVILDDKAGFDHEHDWVHLKEYFQLPIGCSSSCGHFHCGCCKKEACSFRCRRNFCPISHSEK